MELLRISGLEKTYAGAKALDGLSLQLEEGRICALLGNPGSGKTSLLRCLAGLSAPDQGEISLLGKSGEELYEARKDVGFLVDAPQLYGDLSIVNNMLLQSRVRGAVDKKRIGRLLRALKIAPRDIGRRTAGGCPATVKMRLGIAMAFLGAPRLLLLDEVYSGLDTDDSALLETLIREEMEERSMSLLITGQFFSELFPFATDYAFLDKGRIIARYTREQLQEKLPEEISKPNEYEAFYQELRKEALQG